MLTNFNGTSISYDEIGNPSNWHNALSMSWDKRELSSLTLNDNSTLSFTYNSSGLRTSKQFVDAETVTTYLHNYVLDGTTIISETVSANGVEEYTLYYLYEGSAIIGFIYNNAYYYFQKNLQGDIVRILNEGGEVVTEYTYDAWGNVLSVTGTLASTIGQINPFRYRGYYYDVETNWYYLQSRYYDPSVGRFLNADNQLTTGSDLTRLNLFAYCGNNLINRYDPTGHAFETIWDIVSIGFGIVDVCTNPTDPWAWVGLGADLLDLVPFVTCLGEGVRTARITAAVVDTTTDIVKTADNVTDTVRAVDNSTDSLTTIYRSVSDAETDDIISTGQFNLPARGMESKQFAFDYDETVVFGQKMGQNITVSAQLPTSMIPKYYDGGIGGIDTTLFRGGTLTVYAEQLAEFNDAVKGTIKFVP